MSTRRAFLKESALVALAPAVPAFLTQTARAAGPDRDGRVLLVVQLDGGNDGINTVVPFKDDGYARHRRYLRVAEDRLVKISDTLGLHPALAGLGGLLERGQLSIVQGVGYPNPNRSHFESMAIWHTARLQKADRLDLGWLGRGFDEPGRAPRDAPAAVYVGSGEIPVALRGRRAVAAPLTRPEDFLLEAGADGRGLATRPRAGTGLGTRGDLAAYVRRHALDGYATADRMAEVVKGGTDGVSYPPTELAGHLRMVARLIQAGMGTRIYYARQAGYDTHAGQYGPHRQLLSELSGAVAAFLKDLSAAKLAERVAVLCFSEFGRTVRENGSAGTDHGTAGPVFLAGPGVKAGLVGETPSLTELDPTHGDLKVGVDFRRVYASVLGQWLDLPSKDVLGGQFESLPLFQRG